MAKEKTRILPEHIAYTDDDHTKFSVDVELPGVSKDQIQFKILDDSFYLSATTGDKNYVLYHATCHPVIPSEAHAKYENGLLSVDVPFQETMKGAIEVNIE